MFRAPSTSVFIGPTVEQPVGVAEGRSGPHPQRDRTVEVEAVDARLDPRAEPPAGGALEPDVAVPGHLEVDDADDAAAHRAGEQGADRALGAGDGERVRLLPDRERGPLPQHAVRPGPHAEPPCGGGAEPDRVHVVAEQDDGALPRDRVERLLRRAVRPQPVLEADADDRLVRIGSVELRSDQEERLRGGRGAAERDAGRGERRLGDVDVLVPEAAEQHAPVEVDHLRARRVEPGRDRRDTAVGDADVDDRAVDARPAEEQVGHARIRPRAGSASRAPSRGCGRPCPP